MTYTGLELRVLFFVGRGNHKWSSQGNWKGSSSCSDKSQRDGSGWCSGFLPVGEDIGNVCDMEEPLEIPIVNDLTIVLGSISQATAFCEKATMVSAG
ncbi:hypothetical protein RHMOL_Rhmol01G0302500 [Rhododendron molle]|uniref:Uncharacterized protein n=1 Tax=Rhododendron molle TaxID=49168 RepID=A0ACC0Q7M8_RHOML|nr:hypothetical protein RHMOL_Rhmol01G0302500 [Rhododendron molle]